MSDSIDHSADPIDLGKIHTTSQRLEKKGQPTPSYEQYKDKERQTQYPKRLIVCCDGTWMASDKPKESVPSNVARISRLVAREGYGYLYDQTSKKKVKHTMAQITYYQSGIGAGTLKLPEKLLQGAIGSTLEDNLITAYNFICTNYALGDEIFLFGFSRGAYTARALAGLITGCGIMRPGTMDEFHTMYALYKDRAKHGVEFLNWISKNKERLKLYIAHTAIKFLGVWDTVGSLGIPRSVTGFFGMPDSQNFYNVELNDRIARAAHAISIDENLADFCPTLWYHMQGSKPETTNLIQCWFPGYHTDIGGGNEIPTNHIADITLAWMIDQLGDLIQFAPEEIELFVKKSTNEPIGWGEGILQNHVSPMWNPLGKVAGTLHDRTPGEYRTLIEGRKVESFETNEFIHPVTRYRMNMMQQKRKRTVLVDNPNPLKPFGKPTLDKKLHRWYWKKKAAKGVVGPSEIVIPEYQIPASKGSPYVCLGLERRIVPKLLMKEFDTDNGFQN